MPVRLLIADDHQVVRLGVVAMLHGTEFEVAAQAVDCDQALRYTLTCTPNVVLVDLHMPGGDGWQVVQQIKESCPDVAVVVFTAADSVPAMIRARKAGADGYLLKGGDRKLFLKTIRRVVHGKHGWTPRQLRQIGTARRRTYGFNDYIGLTEREAEVITKVVEGMTNEEIAEALNIDLDTVKQHIKSLLARLCLDDRTQVALWASRQHNLDGCPSSDTPS
jgi:DNA-binding NarL/FixJ family response regulator